MARTSNISAKDIIDSVMSAKSRGWTIKDAAASVNMEPSAYRGRLESLKKMTLKAMPEMSVEQKEKAQKVLDLIATSFKDGRGATKQNVASILESVDFSALDALDTPDVE